MFWAEEPTDVLSVLQQLGVIMKDSNVCVHIWIEVCVITFWFDYIFNLI